MAIFSAFELLFYYLVVQIAFCGGSREAKGIVAPEKSEERGCSLKNRDRGWRNKYASF